MQSLYRSFLALALLLAASQVQAQAPSNQDETVRKMLGLALDNIQNSLCDNGKRCSPATAEERANPPLTLVEAKDIVSRAVLSAMGEHCGLDWRRLNYLPMMSHWRNALKSSERKMALIALLHGVAQGQIETALVKRGPCNDADRRQIEVRLSFRA
jgi:hypothetical protein